MCHPSKEGDTLKMMLIYKKIFIYTLLIHSNLMFYHKYPFPPTFILTGNNLITN